jgi:hypothetical protein
VTFVFPGVGTPGRGGREAQGTGEGAAEYWTREEKKNRILEKMEESVSVLCEG